MSCERSMEEPVRGWLEPNTVCSLARKQDLFADAERVCLRCFDLMNVRM